LIRHLAFNNSLQSFLRLALGLRKRITRATPFSSIDSTPAALSVVDCLRVSTRSGPFPGLSLLETQPKASAVLADELDIGGFNSSWSWTINLSP
jgi:hypothetical protein